MVNVDLLAADGSFVATVQVDTAGSAVIFWGVRCFVQQPDLTYREGQIAAGYSIPTQQPMLPFANVFINSGRKDLQ